MSNLIVGQHHLDQATRSDLKCIMVNLGQLTVALPIDCIDKVIKQATVLGSGLTHMGVTHYDDAPITVVDLHYQLFQTRQTANFDQSYLIIAQTRTQQKFAFPIKEAPNLIEFPISELRVLPLSYRRADTLGIATHVVRIALPSDETVTVFILDIDYLAAQCSNE